MNSQPEYEKAVEIWDDKIREMLRQMQYVSASTPMATFLVKFKRKEK